MTLQTVMRRTLAGLVMIASSAVLLALAAVADGWQGVWISPSLSPWILTSPLPALWTAAIFLWTLVLVAVLLSDDRSPRRLVEDTPKVQWTVLDEHVYSDPAPYIRLGRRQPEPIIQVADRRRVADRQDFVA
jgi:hypothetical protein